jgi:hypothetical protein
MITAIGSLVLLASCISAREYPTHIVAPESARGVTADGVPQPFQSIPVGGGWVHVPILYRDGVNYELSEAATTAAKPKPTGPTLAAFRNGALLPLKTTVVESTGPVRDETKLIGDGYTTRVMSYAGIEAWRVQHNMLVPNPNVDTTDMGLTIACGAGPVQSNLGSVTEGYNRAPKGSWTGWVACGGTFVSIRHAKEKYPRGFKVEDGTIKLYQHFENGERVRPGDVSYERIGELRYLHQGKLNTYLPEAYVLAIKNDPRIKADTIEVQPDSMRRYPHVGISSTIDMLIVRYEDRNGLGIPDFKVWHGLHQRGPIVSFVEVPGMKGEDFPEIEAGIKHELCERPLPFHGQFTFGDFPMLAGSLYRIRCPNHYHHVGTTWKHFLRTRDQDFLTRAREYHGIWRDLACLGGGFAHGKGLLPWIEGSASGHWVEPEALRLAWQVDGDRFSKDKYEQYRPFLASQSREAKNNLVQAERHAAYTGKDYSAQIKALRDRIESIPLIDHGAGWFQQPYWASKAFLDREMPTDMIRVAGYYTLIPSVTVGNPERHFAWLSRYGIDKPIAFGPNDGNLALQWGDYLEAVRKKFPNMQPLPVAAEMGDYPLRMSRTETYTDQVGVEVIFNKPAGPLKFQVQGHAFTGSPHTALFRLKKPNGVIDVLAARIPTDKMIMRPSARGGYGADFTIDGPSGVYSLLINSYEAGIYGPITSVPEYAIIQAGARCQQFEGWFKVQGKEPIFVRNSAPGIVELNVTDIATWKVGGLFAAKKEWLP